MFKKILLMVILAMSVVGCELLSPKEWSEYRERQDGRDIKCYERADGVYYCKDRYGNRVMWHGKDKMDDNGLKAMKYIQRPGASHTAVNKIFSLIFIIFYVKILLTKITRKGVNFMITVSINAHPNIEDKINNYVKENNINLNQVMLDLILEKIEDEEDYKLAVEAYEEYKLNKEKAISFEDLVKKMGLENEI